MPFGGFAQDGKISSENPIENGPSGGIKERYRSTSGIERMRR
jgi:hypothetical protein